MSYNLFIIISQINKNYFLSFTKIQEFDFISRDILKVKLVCQKVASSTLFWAKLFIFLIFKIFPIVD